MRDRATSRLACVVLASLCAGAAVAQDIGNQQIQPPSRPAPAPKAPEPAASYLPSVDELNKVQIDARLLSCIGQLGDPTFAVREAATIELLTGDFVRRQIYAALAREKLSGEQRHRLLTAVTDRLLSTPRGAVGISVDRRLRQENKIVINALLPDLPAREVLHVGDRITHLHGQPLVDWEAFVEEVQTRPPGSKITVTVERVISGRRPHRRQIAAQEPKFKTIDVEIELGSAEMLRDPVSGQLQRGGNVYRRFREEADEVAGAFGPQPKQIELGK